MGSSLKDKTLLLEKGKILSFWSKHYFGLIMTCLIHSEYNLREQDLVESSWLVEIHFLFGREGKMKIVILRLLK